MKDETAYYTSVIDTCRLIQMWSRNNPEEIQDVLRAVEKQAESQLGPNTSRLIQSLGVNKSLGIEEQSVETSDYWSGVNDSLTLIRNFLNWKNQSQSTRPLNNFLEEIVLKSQGKLKPATSPLLNKLEIDFSSDFTDFDPSSKLETSEIEQAEKFFTPPIHQERVAEPEPVQPMKTDSYPISEPSIRPDITNENDWLSKEVSPKPSPMEVISAEKVESPLQKNETKDFLASALEELSTSKDESPSFDEDSSKSTWTLRGSSLPETPKPPMETPKPPMETPTFPPEPTPISTPERTPIPTASAAFPLSDIQKDEEEEDEDELLSSSLRDALRMLREED
ncbi:MAG: hypothetical protein ACXAC7_11110 [Candidatus Hodarchaeales archaeon]